MGSILKTRLGLAVHPFCLEPTAEKRFGVLILAPWVFQVLGTKAATTFSIQESAKSALEQVGLAAWTSSHILMTFEKRSMTR